MSKYTTEVRFICESKSNENVDAFNGATTSRGYQAGTDNIIVNMPKLVPDNSLVGVRFYLSGSEDVERVVNSNLGARIYFTPSLSESIERNEIVTAYYLSKVNDIINSASNNIFDFEYPIFDESYKRTLQNKILRHYYTREISEETVALWKLRIEDKLNIIMPYYNKMYETTLIEFDPMKNSDMRREYTRENEGEGSDTRNTTTMDDGSSSTTARQRYSDTPQGALTGVESDTYLTSATKNTNEGTTHNTNVMGTSGSNTISNTEEFIEHYYGKEGTDSYSKLLKEFRQTIINIDEMVIEEFKDLFFGLW